MTILITGSKGFIGSNLIPALKDHTIIEWDRSDGDDIFDDEIDEAVWKSDIIIHLAADTNVAKSFKEPEETFYNNVVGTARIAELAVVHRKKLIFPSSAAVYFPDLSPYAKSKAVAEDIVKGIRGLTDVVIFRFFNIFGPNMNPDSGSLMYNFLTANDLVVFGDGEQRRDFIHVRDVVDIIKESFNDKWNDKIIDVGTGQSYSVNYVAGLFSHYRNMPIKYKPPQREIKWSIANRTMLDMLYKKQLRTELNKDIENLCKAI